MYKSDFDKHIKNNTLSNSFILYGESSFLIDTYTKLLTNIEGASVLKFYFDEYSFESAKAHLSQASLFGDQNILIIKSQKKIPKKELEILAQLCEKNRDNIFVFAYYGDDYTAYKNGIAKFSTMSVRFFHPNNFEAAQIVQNSAKELGIKIDNYTINYLLNIHNHNVALACNELEKLKIFDKEITTKECDQLIFGLSEISTNDLIKKLLLKKDFKDELTNILEHSIDEIGVINAITKYITQLYMFNIYIRLEGSSNALEILGYPAPKHIVDEMASLSIKIKPNTYYKLLKLLVENELKMKSSHNDKNAILLSTLIRFQKLL